MRVLYPKELSAQEGREERPPRHRCNVEKVRGRRGGEKRQGSGSRVEGKTEKKKRKKSEKRGGGGGGEEGGGGGGGGKGEGEGPRMDKKLQ